MPISKDFLNKKMDEYRNLAGQQEDPAKKQYFLGKVDVLYECFQELTKPPKTPEQKAQEEKNKIFDPDSIYQYILDYYMNDKKFIERYPDIKTRKQKANEIAMQKVEEQKQKRMDKF